MRVDSNLSPWITSIYSTLTPTHLILCAAIALVLVWIFLELLVAYSVEFLVLGIIVYTVMMAKFPQALPQGVAGWFLLGGVALFLMMLVIYEFILWRRTETMKEIARKSRLRRYRDFRRARWH
jgi:RsiW-degrading membrane proteinase PrsW (M82 family)